MLSSGDFWEDYDIAGCTEYICSKALKQVALQFPDNMLAVAPAVAMELQKELDLRGHQAQVGCSSSCTNQKTLRSTSDRNPYNPSTAHGQLYSCGGLAVLPHDPASRPPVTEKGRHSNMQNVRPPMSISRIHREVLWCCCKQGWRKRQDGVISAAGASTCPLAPKSSVLAKLHERGALPMSVM